jgi:hypothetical protein
MSASPKVWMAGRNKSIALRGITDVTEQAAGFDSVESDPERTSDAHVHDRAYKAGQKVNTLLPIKKLRPTHCQNCRSHQKLRDNKQFHIK